MTFHGCRLNDDGDCWLNRNIFLSNSGSIDLSLSNDLVNPREKTMSSKVSAVLLVKIRELDIVLLTTGNLLLNNDRKSFEVMSLSTIYVTCITKR
jgi:hypothetical protein